MLSQRCATRALAMSAARPRIVPGANALYARHDPSSAVLRPALAPGVQRRTYILEPLGNAFLAVHSFTGIPWWLLIPAISVLRTAVCHLPYRVLMNRHLAREALISPLMTAWNIKVHLLKVKDPQAAYLRQVKRITREAKISSTALKVANAATTLVTTAVCGGALRSAMFVRAADTVVLEPSFVTGGTLWFQDLTAADPLGILPVLIGAMVSLRSMPRSMAEFQLLFTPGLGSEPRLRSQRIRLLLGPAMIMYFMNLQAGVVLFLAGTTASFQLIPLLDRYLNKYLAPVPKNPWANGAKREPWFIEGPPTRR